MANESLSAAKAAKNDEFYTQYYDIEREINAYLEFDPDVFRGKTVLLPCDDPEWSNFTLYFAQHFQILGLKKLISTSYAPESKKYKRLLISHPFLSRMHHSLTRTKLLCVERYLYSIMTLTATDA